MRTGGETRRVKKPLTNTSNTSKIHIYSLYMCYISFFTSASLEHWVPIPSGTCTKAEGSDLSFLTLWDNKNNNFCMADTLA